MVRESSINPTSLINPNNPNDPMNPNNSIHAVVGLPMPNFYTDKNWLTIHIIYASLDVSSFSIWRYYEDYFKHT
jgi:hypothetical protein